MSTVDDRPQQALRYNQGKAPLSMVPSELIEEVAKVLEFGATKYARDNWRQGMSWNQTLDSCLRHLMKWNSGEDIDPESGLCHLSHAACNIAFLLSFRLTHNEMDDRYVAGSNNRIGFYKWQGAYGSESDPGRPQVPISPKL